MYRAFFILFLLVASLVQAYAQSAVREDEKELLMLNKRYDKAIIGNDVKALEQIFHLDFVYTNPDGHLRTRLEQLEFARSGVLQFETGASNDVRIRIYGNTAVMTGRFSAKGKLKGQDFSINERYTAVWVKAGGKWLLVAEQGNVIKE